MTVTAPAPTGAPQTPAQAPETARNRRRRRSAFDTKPWNGGTRSYDLVKEFVVAIVVVGALVVGLSVAFGSPDDASITMQTWAKDAPTDLVATVAQELAGTSGVAGYGPPYNHTPDVTQKIGPLDLQKLAGVRIPIDTAADFVIGPLTQLAADPATVTAVAAWTQATADQQTAWASAYSDAITAAPDGNYTQAAVGDYGPVPALSLAMLAAAARGSLDPVLAAQGKFYQTNYTYSLLFLSDGTYLENQARAQHLGGDQWGMTNETGSYPGQSWLWLYTFWYQVRPFSTSGNADALVWGLMLVLTAGLALVPFIPGLRSIPRWIPVHRLIWRDYYRANPQRHE